MNHNLTYSSCFIFWHVKALLCATYINSRTIQVTNTDMSWRKGWLLNSNVIQRSSNHSSSSIAVWNGLNSAVYVSNHLLSNTNSNYARRIYFIILRVCKLSVSKHETTKRGLYMILENLHIFNTEEVGLVHHWCSYFQSFFFQTLKWEWFKFSSK